MILLRIKSWQLFLAIFTPVVVSDILDNWASPLLRIISVGVLFGWYLLVGKELNEQLQEDEKENDLFFILNCLFVIVFLSLLSIFGEREELEGSMWVLLSIFYFLFSFFYIVIFTSRAFLAVQEIKSEKSAYYNNQMVYLLFFVYIIGIWFFQPRINKYTVQSL